MYNNDLTDILGNSIDDMIDSLSNAANDVISDQLRDLRYTLKNDSARPFLEKTCTQWKYGEKLVNPLVYFTRQLKYGAYDGFSDKEVDRLHNAAVRLSAFWRTMPEISADELKSNIGYLIVQETILKVMADKNAENRGLKTVLKKSFLAVRREVKA